MKKLIFTIALLATINNSISAMEKNDESSAKTTLISAARKFGPFAGAFTGAAAAYYITTRAPLITTNTLRLNMTLGAAAGSCLVKSGLKFQQTNNINAVLNDAKRYLSTATTSAVLGAAAVALTNIGKGTEYLTSPEGCESLGAGALAAATFAILMDSMRTKVEISEAITHLS